MTPHQKFTLLINALSKEFSQAPDDDDLDITRRIFDTGYNAAIDDCVKALGDWCEDADKQQLLDLRVQIKEGNPDGTQ